jgi:hypothetical protein
MVCFKYNNCASSCPVAKLSKVCSMIHHLHTSSLSLTCPWSVRVRVSKVAIVREGLESSARSSRPGNWVPRAVSHGLFLFWSSLLWHGEGEDTNRGKPQHRANFTPVCHIACVHGHHQPDKTRESHGRARDQGRVHHQQAFGRNARDSRRTGRNLTRCPKVGQQRGWTAHLWFINWNRLCIRRFLLLPSNHRQLLRCLAVAAPNFFFKV